MFYKASNGKIKIDNTFVNYLSFGSGKKNLIIIPGLGESFKLFSKMAVPMAITYKKFAKDFKVYVFFRRNDLKNNYTTCDMANDIISHMDELGIKSASIVGVSEGGMIAQYIAINAPKRVDKLVLAVTVARTNDILNNSVDTWIEMAKKKDYKNIMIDTAKKSYTGKYLKKSVKLYGFLGKFNKNIRYDRFFIQADACKSHNSLSSLNIISCPTLIIGAKEDRVLGFEGSIELHENISNSKLYLYDGYSHGVYEQAKDFNNRVLKFLKND